MLKTIWNVSIILCFTALFMAELSAEPKPAWVSQRPNMPEHYIGVGFSAASGNAEKDWKKAQQSALENLAQEVRVQVISSFMDIMTSRIKDGKEDAEQHLESHLETAVNEVLPGVEIKGRWFSAETKMYWVYAEILKSKVNVEPLSLKLEAIARRNWEGQMMEVVVKSGTQLRSGESLKIYFEVSDDAYVYILLYDSQGVASLIFPNGEINLSNKVKSNVRYQIPDGNTWFWLDYNTGRETIYGIAAREPMPAITTLLRKMEAEGEKNGKIRYAAELKEALSFKTRGFSMMSSSPPKNQPAGSSMQKAKRVSKVVTGLGQAMRIISFDHL